MNVLIVGNGGREHALAWKVAQSDKVEQVWAAPGNAGTAAEPKTTNVAISATDIAALADFAEQHHITLTIVGPEAPLALGIVDHFKQRGLACFGPCQKAALLESSKAFCKQFMQQHNIPTAQYDCFTEVEPALAYLKQQNLPIVIKADGLAAGKGVIIATTLEEAELAVRSMLTDKRFGDAGNQIVIEEFLQGVELSYMVMVDGDHILPLASSQDHKRRDAGDQGPNTGGMGAYSPSPLLNDALEATILSTVIQPTVDAMNESGSPYTGFLYAGLMISPQGEAKVLEFNCRLGDPETQPLMMRLQTDLADLCLAATQVTLDQHSTQWDPRPALDIVLCSPGYPASYPKGDTISGLDQTQGDDIKVFHAGTAIDGDQVVTAGGRVLAVCALADSVLAAQQRALSGCEKINWPGRFYRHDIGHQAIKVCS